MALLLIIAAIVLWPSPASSLYECEAGEIGYVLVSDHEGSPVFWLGSVTAAEVEYRNLRCMLKGDSRVMVLSKDKET